MDIVMHQMEMEKMLDSIVGQLTLEEKIAMIHGAGLFRTGGVDRMKIPPLKMSDGPMGVRNEFGDAEWIPAGNGDDYVSYCPSNSAIAATWNRELAGRCGQVLGEEARGRGKDVILAPGINIKRLPTCGRNFEYFSEDPYLVSELAVPMIQGIEKADVAACVKHFALNNQETERLWVNVEIEERALREIYLPAFEAAVRKAGSKSLMGAYNLFRGQHCCENDALLGEILRKEWQYDGVIISDWGAVHDTKAAAMSPLDIEMSVASDFDRYFLAEPLKKAVMSGEVPEEAIDEKVKHILLLMIRLKMIDVAVELTKDGTETVKISENPSRNPGCYNAPAHRQEILEAARESIVLLKNEGGRLPLAPDKMKKVLIIGDNAVRQHALGGGSAEIKALYEIAPLMGIKMQLGGNCQVDYVPGYYVPEKETTEHNWQEDSLKDAGPAENGECLGMVEEGGADVAAAGKDGEDRKVDAGGLVEKEQQRRLREEAVTLAAEYDQVIYVGGLNHDYDLEGQDRENLKLPYEQDALIEALLQVNPEMIVVMMAGSPVSMGRWAEKAKVILWMSYCGMEGGTALAEILLGKVNPSGKLAETLPERLEDSGAAFFGEFPGRELTAKEKEQMNAHLTQEYKDGIFVGYRYYEKYGVPVNFCFGHGLSYTQFAYENMKLEWADDTLLVKVTVKNTGDVAGKEVVQLYVGEATVSPENPVKELKGFEKVDLQPGESRELTLELTKDSFAHYDTEQKKWSVKKGNYVVYLGSSLQDIRLQEEICM